MAPATQIFKSITDLQKEIHDGHTTVKSVVQRYLQQIDNLNEQLNAVVATNERAIEEAERLDVSCPALSSLHLRRFSISSISNHFPGSSQRTERTSSRPPNLNQRPNRNGRNPNHIWQQIMQGLHPLQRCRHNPETEIYRRYYSRQNHTTRLGGRMVLNIVSKRNHSTPL